MSAGPFPPDTEGSVPPPPPFVGVPRGKSVGAGQRQGKSSQRVALRTSVSASVLSQVLPPASEGQPSMSDFTLPSQDGTEPIPAVFSDAPHPIVEDVPMAAPDEPTPIFAASSMESVIEGTSTPEPAHGGAPDTVEPTPDSALTPDIAPDPLVDPAPNSNKNIMESIMNTTEDFITQGQANVEAVVKSGQIWTAGVQDISKTWAESAQAQFDHSVATWKALASTKSLKEAFEIQSSRTRAALEKAVADGGRVTDASIKLAEQAMAPITARFGAATEKFGALTEKFARPN